MAQPPDNMGNQRESKNWNPPHRPDPDGGRTDRGRGRGRKSPTAQNIRDRPPDGGDGAARQGETA